MLMLFALESPDEEVGESVRRIVETMLEALPRLGLALAVVIVGYAASRVLRWAARVGLSRSQTPSFARVVSKVAGWLLFAVVVLGATVALFPSVRPVDLLAGLGVFSVAIGFAFRDILENTLAGVLLLFR
jgi:small-conductance mechanosensitive channel